MSPSLQESFDALAAPIRGLILDFDGLLADSEPFHFKAYNTVFQRHGHTLDPDEYWVEFTSKGKGIQGEIERHGLKLNTTPEAMRRRKFELYSEFCNNGDIPLFPDALRFVERARRRFSLAIASGSWEHDIRAILRHAGAAPMFDLILGKAPEQRREKPAPDIFLHAAAAMHLPPAQCLVVEDALKGLQAGHKAGMPVLIVRNPLNRGIDFAAAELVVPDLQSLAALLEP
ncbi:MAG: HAD family hydrolase [Nitrospinaceae bacterium]